MITQLFPVTESNGKYTRETKVPRVTREGPDGKEQAWPSLDGSAAIYLDAAKERGEISAWQIERDVSGREIRIEGVLVYRLWDRYGSGSRLLAIADDLSTGSPA